MELKDLAKTALTYFERSTRNNGDKIWVTKDNRPDWLYDLIHEAHGDMLPDDYKYEFVVDALGTIEEYGDEDDYFEGIDASVDVYTSALTKWLASHIERTYYLNEAIKEYSGEKDTSVDFLMVAQFKEREEVFYSVLQSLKEQLEEEEFNEEINEGEEE
jgi:hypothetical protein